MKHWAWAATTALWSASASAGPFSFSYGGRLADQNSVAVGGPVDIEVKFFRNATGGSAVGVSPQVFTRTTLDDGVFQVDLNLLPAELHTVFTSADAAWIEVTDKTHNVTYPRQRLNAVPYALKVPVDGSTVTYDANGQLTAVAPAAAAVDNTSVADGALAQSKVNGLAGALTAKQDVISPSVAVSAGSIATSKPVGVELKPAGTAAGSTGEVRFDELAANGANHVSLKAADALASDLTFVLPAADGSNGQLLRTDGAGHLSWAPPAGGGTITEVTTTAATGLTGGGAGGSVNLALDVGTTVGKIVQLGIGGKLPAVDGSLLTNLSSASLSGALPALNGSALSNLSSANLVGALPAVSGSALTSLTSASLSGALPALDGSALTNLSAANLSGTLPALNGSALTNLDAASLSGTLPALNASALTSLNAASLSGTLPALNGSALTSLNAASLSGTLPALNGSALTNLPTMAASGASHAPGVVPDPGASAGTTKFLREDATWSTLPALDLSSPPAIGATTAASGHFTTLQGGATSVTSLTASGGISGATISGTGLASSGTISGSGNISTTGGSLGVGIASPGTKLHVKDNVNATVYAQVENANTGVSADAALLLKDGSGSTWELGITASGATNSHDFYIYDQQSSLNRLYISKSNGNVGIGTDTPGAQLQVASSFRVGSTGGNVTGFGTCNLGSVTISSGANSGLSCTGVTAGAVVTCSPGSNFSGVWSAYSSTTDNVTIYASGGGSAMNWKCAWVK